MSGQGESDTRSAAMKIAGCARGSEPGVSIPNCRSSRRENCRQADVALIDESPLRRASTLILLRIHIRLAARPFAGAAEFLSHVPKEAESPCCIIKCVGGRSVKEPPIPEHLQRLHEYLPSTPVVVLSDRDESEEVIAAFREGARGFVPTSLEPRLVIKAIRMVLAGGTFVPAGALMRSRFRVQVETQRSPRPEQVPIDHRLSGPEQVPVAHRLPCPNEVSVEHREPWPPRQVAVLSLLIEGKANKEIARALAMEESTVKVHVRHIMRKLGVTNRTQAAISARRLGIPVGGESGSASAVLGARLATLPTQPQCFSGVPTT